MTGLAFLAAQACLLAVSCACIWALRSKFLRLEPAAEAAAAAAHFADIAVPQTPPPEPQRSVPHPPQYRMLAEATPHPVFTAGADGVNDYCNRAWDEYSGLSEAESYAGGWASIVHPADAPSAVAQWQRSTAGGIPFAVSRETRDVLDALGHIIAIRSADGALEYMSPSWSQYTGKDLGATCADVDPALRDCLHPDDHATVDRQIRASNETPSAVHQDEIRLRGADGTYRWFVLRTVALAETVGARWIVTATDIEARRNAEAALAHSTLGLAHRAHHDPLTNLPNRTRLMDRLAQMIDEANRTGTNVAVMYLDVDYFKTVNDTLGHNAGDELLVEVAARINSALRTDDIASRFGGDEFVLVAAADPDAAAQIAERLQAAIARPLELRGKRIVVSCSIGISLFPYDGSRPADLIAKADQAMCDAKQSGRNAWNRYTSQTSAPAMATLEFEAELREAIALEQFVVYYQPIVSVETGRPVGAEALVRWQHPQRGLLGPGEFVNFAENHGLIAPIGEFVLHTACAELQRLGLRARDDFSISVNVSAHQFQKPGFVDTIASAIQVHGIDPRRLDIEITESVVMYNTAAVIATLDRLRALDVKLSIDDFGTGYSSLAYIKNFPINTLKIDRSFVTDIARSFTDQAIAKTIVTLAHSLGMRVVAEGIESAEQLALLRSFGADCFQGFLVSQPLSRADFEQFFGGRRALSR